MLIKNNYNFDRQHIWHPYSSIKKPFPCYQVIKAKGCKLKLNNGKTLIDGMSSWLSAIHGYNHPRLNLAIKKQIKKMSHVMFGGLTHISAISLCRKLIEITPLPLECIFLCDSGSVSIEVSMKMALQYWLGRKENRQKFLALQYSYHGDTFAAMSVCDPKNSMHNLWKGYLTENYFAEAPKCGFYENWSIKDFDDFAYLIEKHHKKLAAVIIEPIVQGAGGMRIYNPKYLQLVREYCNLYDVLLIVDEIATGFGRTGKLFAFEYSDIEPDILCLGKALTGGTMTLAATITTREIADTISNSYANCFMHGPTFMGNPMACAVAVENLNILQNNDWVHQVGNIEKQLFKFLLPLKNSQQVSDIRILGAIGVVETNRSIDIAAIQNFFVRQGVWIRPFGKLIYLVPPYIIKEHELKKLIESIFLAIEYPLNFL
ncbi:adenosylmethionine--8-amino-7-oxononanoate transaminase [Candidatus Pantoea edessiphila]|uniref:Adenosylmethionine-8-amino-7-oxononanoate aminotransferase n=1 Tax=Candidatus Pantoea edessiphila TaxID=2044610 RepID=A0A2P5SYY2_9GAMM|nr:adenosylmethionine--8-amino-7-oxononanoate transaminase [Candidatus Pantoea edessiphila]MBK4775306.1 adenosylmethionine--8-amino-7-oxononanoate transaminase [Pantoea sp. Edef]PPI87557.1 adenosylmethionine--8-amino-7-oxononanoate transaminase [Candidatus Pantoea edessiphila]